MSEPPTDARVWFVTRPWYEDSGARRRAGCKGREAGYLNSWGLRRLNRCFSRLPAEQDPGVGLFGLVMVSTDPRSRNGRGPSRVARFAPRVRPPRFAGAVRAPTLDDALAGPSS